MVINGEGPFLSEEIIINILKRLPVKSLMRFQCVCKHWKNLFKISSFIQDHLRHSTHQNPSLVIASKDRDDGFYSLSFNSDLQVREIENAPLNDDWLHGRGIRPVGSSNGLLCFEDWSKYDPPRKQHASPLVWNPATREVRQVPIISDDFSDLSCHFEFGFSPIIDDYRIVRFSSSPLAVCKVEVYSLRTGCWRNIEFDNIKDVCINGHAVTANGVMFWRGSKSIMDTNDAHVIVSFDLATEVFRVIPWPDSVRYGGKLAVYDGKLAIISYSRSMLSQFYDLEGMKDDVSLYFSVMEEGAIGSPGERWSSSNTYTGNSDFSFCDGTIWRNQIVCIDYAKPTFTKKHGMDNNERLYLIDLDANECKIFDIPRPKSGFGVCVFNYVESLVPVSGNIRIEEP